VSFLRCSRGFTLIELMIVVVIIGILAAVAIPNMISLTDRSKEAQVKANCRTVSLVAEDLAIQSGGIYPNAIGPMMAVLPNGQLLTNPFTNQATEPRLGAGNPGPGEVNYEPTVANGVTNGYNLRGGGRNGTVIQMVNGAVF
jgi:prepilin-type N-terminal cleavage/methylation domain-containing protein